MNDIVEEARAMLDHASCRADLAYQLANVDRLEHERDLERVRAERAERTRDEIREEAQRLKHVAERAERERDEARAALAELVRIEKIETFDEVFDAGILAWAEARRIIGTPDNISG